MTLKPSKNREKLHEEGSRDSGPGWRMLAIGYTLLIVYGTLYPLTGWQRPAGGLFDVLALSWPARLSRTDLLINFLAYMPFGLFWARAFAQRSSAKDGLWKALAWGAALSLLLEWLQAFLPNRVSSLADFVTNSGGAFAGALLSRVLPVGDSSLRRVREFRQTWFEPGRLADLGLTALGLWVLSQLAPLAPSFDLGNIKTGLRPAWHTLKDPASFQTPEAAAYALFVLGVGVVLATVLLRSEKAPGILLLLVAAVLFCKVPVVSRQLSLEAMFGAGAGVIAFFLVSRLGERRLAVLGILCLVLGFTVSGLRPVPGASSGFSPMNLIPLRGHMQNIVGLADIFAGLWPFWSMAYLARFISRERYGKSLILGGGLALILIALAVERAQRYLPGRSPDVTDVLMAGLGWSLPWLFSLRQQLVSAPGSVRVSRRRRTAPVRRRPIWPLAAAAVILLGGGLSLGKALVGDEKPAVDLTERHYPKIPNANELPPVELAGFRNEHPRLPAPTREESARLERENPGYLDARQAHVNAGRGGLELVILLARTRPGSQDLDKLFDRLMKMGYGYRGNESKVIAMGYDWLYDQWTEPQRKQLAEKVAGGCGYLMDVIRDQRLSPYNVYLYNSPFQSLVACTLAVYGDHPFGDLAMRYTHHLLKEMVLPAWRQIMGENGGWHEGGEYVGIGIGQAIYQVPAMWREATGEDLFAAEPGIRGFLDYLVYRTRPDGTCYRWGDAAYFNRNIPDRLPLAIEARHAAAYSLDPPRDRLEPTGWPWGPFTDPTLDDPVAVEQLPLSRHFDGIGMLVARSDWSDESTYVTFKTGDNYWSHSHLDQGAFTIYKGGALAIDSGLYGPRYGADHHMNYAYQAIAHNTVTVKDPEDTVPIPRKKEPRPIANDGGQRRVGSGWGTGPAPLDRNEWEELREVFHTGKLEKVFMEDDLVVGVADVTPAYINSLSGKGTFAHRTRRVEKFWRTFIYDRLENVIIVFDRVEATNPEFKKRWLLHTIERPEVSDQEFAVKISPELRRGKLIRGHAGGRLFGKVLFPENGGLDAVGGPGAEFLVDGKNYDAGGKVREIAEKRAGGETGEWRLELSPSAAASEDVFLVVMQPSALEENPGHDIRALRDGERIGCEVAGRHRTTRWWFEPGRNGVRVAVLGQGAEKNYDLTVAAAKEQISRGWWELLTGWLQD